MDATLAQRDLLDYLKKENAYMTYILKQHKEIEDAKKMVNDIGQECTELRKENSELKSSLRLGRAKYADLQKENRRLKRDIDEYLNND
jgi:regulator of replication initiation timing